MADLLPGGIGRDTVLVLAFATVLMVALAANPNPTRRTLLVTAPLLLAVAGAALLGTGRAVTGRVLGVVAFDLLTGAPVVRPLHLAAYGFVALAMAVAGHLAAAGRLWLPARAGARPGRRLRPAQGGARGRVGAPHPRAPGGHPVPVRQDPVRAAARTRGGRRARAGRRGPVAPGQTRRVPRPRIVTR